MSREQQTSNNDQSYDQVLLQNIRQQICLNNHQLLELTYNDQKFKQKLKQLNHLGYNSILQLKYHEALIYLNQAQKVLQYAASCGKTIQRTLIITTLNNQASLYQRAWELEKAASYIQAIIYNISQFFQKQQQFQFTEMILDQDSVEYQNFRIYLWRKKILAIYYLQFCAVNSQNKKHQNAYNSASKAILLLKYICNDCYKYQTYINKHNNNNKKYDQPKNNQRNILKELYNLKPLQKSQTNFESLFSKAINCIAVYMKRSQQSLSQRQQLKNKFSTYSIGHLMQINPFQLQKDSDKIDLNKQISLIQKIFKSVYVSIGHFILATELRFISTEKYTFDQNQRKNSNQYKQSQNYHLYSIIIAAKFLPCNSVYFQHIVNSFKNHYKIDLIQNVKQYLQNNHNPIDQDEFYQQDQQEQHQNQHNQQINLKQNYQTNQNHKLSGNKKDQSQNKNVQQNQQKQQVQSNNFDIKTQKSQQIKQDIKKQLNIQDQIDIPSNDTKSTKKIKKTQTSLKKNNNLKGSKKNIKKSQVKNTSNHSKRLSTTENQNFIRTSNINQNHLNHQLTNRSSGQKQNKLKSLNNRSSKSKKKQSLHFNNKINKKSQTQNNFKKNNGYRQNSTKKQKRDSDYHMEIAKSRSKSKRISTNAESQKISFKKQKQLQQIKKNKRVEEQYGINMAQNIQKQTKNGFKPKKKTKEKSKSMSKKKSIDKSIKFTSPELKIKKLKSPKNLKKAT